MNYILLLLLSFEMAVAFADDTVSVYHMTGTIQCIQGTGVSPEKAADLLRGQGVKVLAAERRKLPLGAENTCGAPADEANVMKVAAADWANFVAKNPDAGGYGLWVFDEGTAEVYKYDGTLQCGMGRETTPEEMAKELEAAGIEVLSSRKGNDGLVHIQVCGASTGAINVFVINREALPAAKRLGYRVLVTREMTRRIKFGLGRPLQHQAQVTVQSAAANSADRAGPWPVPVLW